MCIMRPSTLECLADVHDSTGQSVFWLRGWLCANPNCFFVVNEQVSEGNYCCKKCHWRDASQVKSKAGKTPGPHLEESKISGCKSLPSGSRYPNPSEAGPGSIAATVSGSMQTMELKERPEGLPWSPIPWSPRENGAQWPFHMRSGLRQLREDRPRAQRIAPDSL